MQPNLIFTLVIMAGVLITAFVTMTLNDLFLLIILPLVLLGIFLLSRPGLMLALVLSLGFSSLTLPPFPVNLNLFQFSALGLCLFLIVYKGLSTNARHTPDNSLCRTFTFVFIGILMITMAIRGVGIRALDSRLWGGAGYVSLLISAWLFLSADVLALTPRQWKSTLLAIVGLSFLPAIAQIVYLISGGTISQQYSFIQPSGFIASTLSSLERDAGVARYSTGFSNLLILTPFLFLSRPFSGKQLVLSGLVIVTSIALGMLGGSRASLIENLLFLIFWLGIMDRSILLRRLFFLAVVAVIILSGLALIASHLPLAVQRSLTLFPFADVSWEARHDAFGTFDWRLDLWGRAIKEIPNYLLIGQGLAFDSREILSLLGSDSYVREWALVTHCYHQGILSLLLIFGVPGLVAGLVILASAFFRHYRLFHSYAWNDNRLQRIHKVMLCVLVTQIVKYILVYGDVHVSFPTCFFFMVILEGLYRSDLVMTKPPPADARPEASRKDTGERPPVSPVIRAVIR